MDYRWVLWVFRLGAAFLAILFGYNILKQTYLLLSGTAPQMVRVTWAVSDPWKTAGYYWIVSFSLTLLYLSWYYREELYIGGRTGPGTRPFTYGLLGAAFVSYIMNLIMACATQSFPLAMTAVNNYFSRPLTRFVTPLSGGRLDGTAGAVSATFWFILLAVIFALVASVFYRLIERYETTFETEEEETSS